MIKSIENAFVLCLLVTFAAGGQLQLHGADLKTAAVSSNAVPNTLSGKIIAIDRATGILTVEVKGKLLQIPARAPVLITKDGKSVLFDEFAAGQNVTITFSETPAGRLEIVSVTILPAENASEPAGNPVNGKGKGPPFTPPGPPPSTPPVVSPFK
jgi:hypothetical protein